MKSQLSTVLMVDDCPFNIVAIQSLLQQFNISCDYGTNGQDAFDSVKNRLTKGQPMYKLILMDFSMPVIDGPTGSRMIRDLLSEAGIAEEDQTFICCVTAYSETKFIQIAKAAGMDTYLVKPVFKDDMHKLLIKVGLL